MTADGKDASDEKQRTKSDYFYFQTYLTRWSDNDQYSHVNNAIYYHLIDSIVNTYLAERCGCKLSHSSADIAAPPIGLVVSSYCNFYAPLTFPEPITLGLRIVKLGRSSVSYEVGFFTTPESNPEGRGESVKAVGGYTHVFVDREHRRPIKEMEAILRNGLRAISIESSTAAKL